MSSSITFVIFAILLIHGLDGRPAQGKLKAKLISKLQKTLTETLDVMNEVKGDKKVEITVDLFKCGKECKRNKELRIKLQATYLTEEN